jgi:hypothetical protein
MEEISCLKKGRKNVACLSKEVLRYGDITDSRWLLFGLGRMAAGPAI